MRLLLTRSLAVVLILLVVLIAGASTAGAEEVLPGDGPWVSSVVGVTNTANSSELEVLVALTKPVDPSTLIPGQTVQLLTTSELQVPISTVELSESSATLVIRVEDASELGPLHVVLAGDSSEGAPVIADLNGTPLGTNPSHPYGRNYIGEVHPTISSVAVPPAGTYGDGESLDFVVRTSEPTYVDTTGGSPSVPIELGDGAAVHATYLQGSGTEQLTFAYTVLPGDTGGISLASALVLGGGTLTNAAGYTLVPTLVNIEDASGVQLDGVVPVSAPPPPTLPTAPPATEPLTSVVPAAAAPSTLTAVQPALPVACTSRRTAMIHLLVPRGIRLRQATVLIDNRPLTSLGRGKSAVAVSFVGWPPGNVTLRIQATTIGGLHLISVRHYHLCSGTPLRSADQIVLHRVRPTHKLAKKPD